VATATATPKLRAESLVTGTQVSVTSSTTAWQNYQETTVEAGRDGTVINGPSSYGGRTWYKVALDDGSYWIPAGTLEASGEQAAPTGIVYWVPEDTIGGANATDVTAGASVTLSSRTTAWHGEIETTVPAGFDGVVVDGPNEYGGRTWYKIQIGTEAT
jgi:hypothetical protein